MQDNLLYGLIASIGAFLLICVHQLPDGILHRPHVYIWRLIKGINILYVVLLIFLQFQSLEDIRSGLSYIDPSLGKPLPEMNYAKDCRLVKLIDSIDVFVACHLFGWLVKALVIRDFKMLWFLQLFFEWMEISLRHILPNFWECWWDHLILDVFGCNALGIFIGMYIVNRFNMKTYTWRLHHQNWKSAIEDDNEENIDALRLHYHQNKLLVDEGQQTETKDSGPEPRPTSHVTDEKKPDERIADIPWWSCYAWPGCFSSFETFVALSVFCVAVTLLDLNLFFIKAELWIPTSHFINASRTFWFAAAAAATTREFYEFISDKRRRGVGIQSVLGLSAVLLESSLAYRLRHGLPDSYPLPDFVYNSWIVIAIVWCLIAIVLFFTRRIKFFPPSQAALAAGVSLPKYNKWYQFFTNKTKTQ